MPLHFKKALVTGGSSGIGAAIASSLVAEGVVVTGVSRHRGSLPAAAEFVACDLSNTAEVAKLVDFVAAGDFDLLVNAAGSGEMCGFEETPDAAWEANRWILLEAPRRLMAAMLPARKNKSGAVVNVTSLAVEFPLPAMAPYNTHKAALAALTESLREEFPKIQFIDIRPGDIASNFGKDWKIPAGAPWARAASKQLASMAVAPAPILVARAVVRALRARRAGVVRVGSFFQAVVAPLGARLLPREFLRLLRIKYLQ